MQTEMAPAVFTGRRDLVSRFPCSFDVLSAGDSTREVGHVTAGSRPSLPGWGLPRGAGVIQPFTAIPFQVSYRPPQVAVSRLI